MLLLCLLDGLYEDLRKTETTSIRRKAAWLAKKAGVMGHHFSGKFNLSVYRTRAACRLSQADDGRTHPILLREAPGLKTQTQGKLRAVFKESGRALRGDSLGGSGKIHSRKGI